MNEIAVLYKRDLQKGSLPEPDHVDCMTLDQPPPEFTKISLLLMMHPVYAIMFYSLLS